MLITNYILVGVKGIRDTKTADVATLEANDVAEASALRVALGRLHRQLRTHSGNPVTASQASALARIEQVGPLRLGVLAALEGTTAATMCRVVDNLEEGQLIARVPDPVDGRASLIQLSPEGDALLASLRAKSTEALRAALAQLSPAERADVARAVPAMERLCDLLRSERLES